MIRLLALLVLLFTVVSANAVAQTCTTITVPAHVQYVAGLGTCTNNGNSCSATDGSCGDNGLCMVGYCSNDQDSLCVQDSDCGGGNTCETDIVFTLSKAHNCGQFVNGDWWVEADDSDQVTINRIQPDMNAACEINSTENCDRSGCRNGWNWNPVQGDGRTQMGDGRYFKCVEDHFSIPYQWTSISGVISVAKFMSGTVNTLGQRVVLARGPIPLTIVPNGQAPEAGDFRPGLWGDSTEKLPSSRTTGGTINYYNISEVDTSEMPSLALSSISPANLPTKDGLGIFYYEPEGQRNRRNSQGNGELSITRGCGPYSPLSGGCAKMSQYHGYRAAKTGDALLRFMFDDWDYSGSETDKALLYLAIQDGLDQYAGANAVASFTREKGYFGPIAFASKLLGDPDLISTVWPADTMQNLYWDTVNYGAGHPADCLWGSVKSNETLEWLVGSYCKEETHTCDSSPAADKWSKDAFGYRDGANCCTSYYRTSVDEDRNLWLMMQAMQLQDEVSGAGNDGTLGCAFKVLDRHWNGWHETVGASGWDGGRWCARDDDPCISDLEPGTYSDGGDPDCIYDGSCICDTSPPPLRKNNQCSIDQHGNQSGQSNAGSAFGADFNNTFGDCLSDLYQGQTGNPNFPCAGMVSATAYSFQSTSFPGGVDGYTPTVSWTTVNADSDTDSCDVDCGDDGTYEVSAADTNCEGGCSYAGCFGGTLDCADTEGGSCPDTVTVRVQCTDGTDTITASITSGLVTADPATSAICGDGTLQDKDECTGSGAPYSQCTGTDTWSHPYDFEACDPSGTADTATCNYNGGNQATSCQLAQFGDSYINTAAGEECEIDEDFGDAGDCSNPTPGCFNGTCQPYISSIDLCICAGVIDENSAASVRAQCTGSGEPFPCCTGVGAGATCDVFSNCIEYIEPDANGVIQGDVLGATITTTQACYGETSLWIGVNGNKLNCPGGCDLCFAIDEQSSFCARNMLQECASAAECPGTIDPDHGIADLNECYIADLCGEPFNEFMRCQSDSVGGSDYDAMAFVIDDLGLDQAVATSQFAVPGTRTIRLQGFSTPTKDCQGVDSPAVTLTMPIVGAQVENPGRSQGGAGGGGQTSEVIRGDLDEDGQIDVGDILALSGCMFGRGIDVCQQRCVIVE